jgi:hypothetical protein
MKEVPYCFLVCSSCKRKKHECVCKDGYWMDAGLDQLGRPIRRKCAYNRRDD